MVLFRSCVLATALSISCAGLASASTLAFHTDVYDAGGVTLGSGVNKVEWEFNILIDGYDPLTESVTSATIAISLRDYDYVGHKSEKHEAEAELSVNGNEILEWDVYTGTEVVRLTAFTTLSETGKLLVSLEAEDGKFYFDQATLVAHDVSAVPVPAAVWLFGSGLLGLAGFARAKNKA